MKKIVSCFMGLLLGFMNSNAHALPVAECVDSYHSYYNLYIKIDSCAKDLCKMSVFQHNSPNSCMPFDREFEVVKKIGKDGVYEFNSSAVSLKINTNRGPNKKTLQGYGRPFSSRRPIYRGQVRVLDLGAVNQPPAEGCLSALQEKYRGLVCTLKSTK